MAKVQHNKKTSFELADDEAVIFADCPNWQRRTDTGFNAKCWNTNVFITTKRIVAVPYPDVKFPWLEIESFDFCDISGVEPGEATKTGVFFYLRLKDGRVIVFHSNKVEEKSKFQAFLQKMVGGFSHAG